MNNKVTCRYCKYAKYIEDKMRIRMSHENKEILNILEQQGLEINKLRYCKKTGFIESVITRKECDKWMLNHTKDQRILSMLAFIVLLKS